MERSGEQLINYTLATTTGKKRQVNNKGVLKETYCVKVSTN